MVRKNASFLHHDHCLNDRRENTQNVFFFLKDGLLFLLKQTCGIRKGNVPENKMM